ncbi:DUF6192 family protein [Streptomyces europaeiscabiei]|uniref:DUF6192 family protein n=1 Tax=Streptomyces europaeiscabiei TaxID=146819 RepID=UPI003985BC85
MSGSPVRLRWLSPRDIGAQPVRNRRTVTTSGGRRTSVPRRTQPRPPPTASSSTPGPGPCPGEAEAIREPACDDVVLAAQVATDSLRRSEIAFKALRDAEARETVNQAQFQTGRSPCAHTLHSPPHRGDRGNRRRRGPRPRRPASGHRRSPAPDTPRSRRADPPDRLYWMPKRVRDARPAPMPTDPRAGEAGGDRRRRCVGWRGCE